MNNHFPPSMNYFTKSLPKAIAIIHGNNDNKKINGNALFYEAPQKGIFIQVTLYNLPDGFFGMHIHEFGNCISPFDQVGSHYNPTSQPHPDHAGDLPPLFSTFGYAWTFFYDGRVAINEIIGKSIIIHSNKDDFTTQPSGNSGEKIACGVIQSI